MTRLSWTKDLFRSIYAVACIIDLGFQETTTPTPPLTSIPKSPTTSTPKSPTTTVCFFAFLFSSTVQRQNSHYILHSVGPYHCPSRCISFIRQGDRHQYFICILLFVLHLRIVCFTSTYCPFLITPLAVCGFVLVKHNNLSGCLSFSSCYSVTFAL